MRRVEERGGRRLFKRSAGRAELAPLLLLLLLLLLHLCNGSDAKASPPTTLTRAGSLHRRRCRHALCTAVVQHITSHPPHRRR